MKQTTDTKPTVNEKTFDLGKVLSITTGRLLCEMDGVYEILNHVTGDNLFTHVLPRANKFADPLIKAQYPELETASLPKNLAKLDTLIADAKARNEPPMTGVNMWLDWMQESGTLGLKSEYNIKSHADAWISRHPVQELVDMMGLFPWSALLDREPVALRQVQGD